MATQAPLYQTLFSYALQVNNNIYYTLALFTMGFYKNSLMFRIENRNYSNNLLYVTLTTTYRENLNYSNNLLYI